MKKKYRLLKSADFQTLLRRGSNAFSTHLVCYWKPDSLITNIKIGIIIPKKKCKLSCNRKYYKRVFWAINNKELLNACPKIKCVFFYKDVFFERFKKQEVTFADLQNEYLNLMSYLEKKASRR
ncbi:ribonuclease P protein component [Candidatus Mycoplasma haematohominis]|uniref:Ribonuclease P n=1 Tax=Candidatus Mycoplasma haematohominis TaxID=1494318 RepID=A0A478FS50_9MOLU|nr:ribonuclease P protein component [Candidatus Mycoplasma haemohominis]GCE63196.1 ribonuclease P [Candidatus Mycoplasma haemohominis]